MVKKAKKTISVYKKIHQFISRNKRESVVVGSLIMLLIALLGVGAYMQYSANIDKNDVIKMRGVAKTITTHLSRIDPSLSWRDGSYCSVVSAKAFGEKTEYACTALYQASKSVGGQSEIDKIVDDHSQALSSIQGVDVDEMDSLNAPAYTDDSAILNSASYQKLSQVSGYEFTIKNTNSVKCNLKYELKSTSVNSGVALVMYVNCYTPTKSAYFEPIKYL